jgi:hypothetical protein
MLRLAAIMDARETRLGVHTANTTPVWAVQALGDVPEPGTPGRDAWQKSAGRIAAAREMLGWDHEGLALGPQPGTTSPEARAEWDSALSVMAKVDGIDVRGLSDGLLLARRAAFERETAWSPASVADELRVIRLTGLEARTEAARCAQDATAARRAGRDAWAVLHESRTSDRRAVQEKCTRLIAELEPAQATRQEWESITADTLRVALAADQELKRRGVLRPEEGMKSAEPEGLVPGSPDDEGREDAVRRALGIDAGSSEASAKVTELAERSRATQARIDEIRSMPQPDAENGDLAPGEAWSRLIGRERESILQPPEQLVPPSPEVTVTDRELA